MTLYELNNVNFLSVCVRINVVDTTEGYEIVDTYEEKWSEELWGIIDEDKYPSGDDYEILNVSATADGDLNWIVIDVELPIDERDR